MTRTRRMDTCSHDLQAVRAFHSYNNDTGSVSHLQPEKPISFPQIYPQPVDNFFSPLICLGCSPPQKWYSNYGDLK